MNIQFISLKNLIDKNYKYINIIKKKYLLLLNQLTQATDISDQLFINNINTIFISGLIYIAYICNPYDDDFEIIASGTIFIEPKIIRGGRSVGHIEDIVVLSTYRGLGLSKNILNEIKNYGYKNNCYKLILDCYDELCPVYEKIGFEKVGNQMSLYY
jgi:GNAT superfamily N-acetyltransferase